MARNTALSSMQVSLGENKGTAEVIYHRSTDQTATIRPSLLFLPFWGGTAHTYSQVLTSPALQSFNVLAVSYPGTSTTTVPDPDNASLHSIKPRAENLATLLQDHKIRNLIPSGKLIVIAHSMSAKISYELLGLLQTQSQPTIIRLVLLGPAPPTPLVLPPEMRANQPQIYSTHESALWALTNVLTHNPVASDVLAKLADDCVSMTPAAKQGWIEQGMDVDCTDTLRKLAPTMPNWTVSVLVGKQDQVETPDKVQKETVAALQDLGWAVDLRLVDGCGHLIPVEKAEAIVEEILRVQDS